MKELEVWADSFKEGEWFVANMASAFNRVTVETRYEFGFQPVFEFDRQGGSSFTAYVYGDYRGWDPVPDVISEVLDYGKPDIILYDRNDDFIFFAVEETAAVPTGNQSLQRLERVSFAAEQQIPFVYLVSEYGLHRDKGVRRSSIWPSYMALKVSSQYEIPSLTLLYGDAEHPEDYSVGSGVEDLAVISELFVRDWLGEDVEEKKEKIFARVFDEMGEFIQSQVDDISPFLPGKNLLRNEHFLKLIADRTAEYEA